jgi:hypothetical protein
VSVECGILFRAKKKLNNKRKCGLKTVKEGDIENKA